MDADFIVNNFSTDGIEQEAYACLIEGQYDRATALYEQLIVDYPAQFSYYYQLGLALCLQGKETEAQLAWIVPISESQSGAEKEQRASELANVLRTEAERQAANSEYEVAWLLRQHLRGFAPEDTDNLLQILELALQAQLFSFEDGLLAETIAHLQSHKITEEILMDRLLQLSRLLLQHDPGHADTLNFLETCIPHFSNQRLTEFVHLLLAAAQAYSAASQSKISSRLDHLVLPLVSQDIKVLLDIIYRFQGGSIADRLESIQIAKRCLAMATDLAQKIAAVNALLASWIFGGGDWQQATKYYQDYKALLQSLVQAHLETQSTIGQPIANTDAETSALQELGFLSSLIPVGSLFLYFEDNPQNNRPLRHQIAQIAQTHLQATLSDEVIRYQTPRPTTLSQTKLPRIGYFSGSLRQHSVGWLCRWLLAYHDRDRFDIHLYSPRPSHDPIQQEFRQTYGDRFHDVPSTVADIANQIYDDQIDILVELDSLTSFGGCGVVALKPAPIQVHWLGYDASGIPGVDYFIVDPYVVPEDAQRYYSETLWRLPSTYIAVDGFETHIPSLRRDQLGIPGDAIVYLSSQTGMKRNIDNVRLQMQVIKAVPNSYFLIKSFLSNPEFIETFFQEVAESEGVSLDRLRFLPDVSSEFVHRANLAVADIILDTYPYNGATTTLEALWTGLPIVTRVGEQFAARNSYTMMMNAGIVEGIAWNNEEYLAWGIRLGTDAALRQDISYRLKRSRHTSPLWNARAFTQDMEKAYEQMWQRI
ncbi:MAG TPA: O-linked N-acetylglucosamine transferase, SPINDLY family protein [Coleofasciculaceae cyanobacterium]